jgi:hypothetical protein
VTLFIRNLFRVRLPYLLLIRRFYCYSFVVPCIPSILLILGGHLEFLWCRKCGCGEGDSGCSVCGICRRCADTFAAAGRAERVTDLDDDADASTKSDTRNGE